MANNRNPDSEERFFEGRRYSRPASPRSKSRARYFYCREWDKRQKRYVTRALHRDVWQAAHGPIPDGCHIHHADGNWDNNDVANLECITASQHHRLHGANAEFKRKARRWMRRNGAKLRAAAQAAIQRPKLYACERCGKPFVAKGFNARFCRRAECVRGRLAERERAKRVRLRSDR
jgi:HNH endonuclease